MARRQQRRRPAFQPRREKREDKNQLQALIDTGARRLLAAHDPVSLRALVSDLRGLGEQAEREAYEQPSPDALRRCRIAARELAEGERALTLLGEVTS